SGFGGARCQIDSADPLRARMMHTLGPQDFRDGRNVTGPQDFRAPASPDYRTTTSVPKAMSLRLGAVNVSVMVTLPPFLSVFPDFRRQRYGTPSVVPVAPVSLTSPRRFVNCNDNGPVSGPLLMLVSVTVSLYSCLLRL